MTAQTPVFLGELRTLIEKLSPQKEEGSGVEDENSEEVRKYLREKLAAVKEACETFDKKAAKGAINELRQKTWSGPTTELLSTMAEHLLNGDFDEVVHTADKIIETL